LVQQQTGSPVRIRRLSEESQELNIENRENLSKLVIGNKVMIDGISSRNIKVKRKLKGNGKLKKSKLKIGKKKKRSRSKTNRKKVNVSKGPKKS
jgi:hypothetical protein